MLLLLVLEQINEDKQIRVLLLLFLLLVVFGGASIDVLLAEDIHPFQGHPCSRVSFSS